MDLPHQPDPEIAMMVEELKEKLEGANPFEALPVFEKIVKESTDRNLSAIQAEESAELLATHIKSSSSHRKQHFMKLIQKLDGVPKILLLRCLSEELFSDLSMEKMLTTAQGRREFQKMSLPYPMAFGVNKNGKLGVGDDVSTEKSFREVKLDGDILQILIGTNHTIFKMENGECYACGFTNNFLKKPMDEPCQTPIKLDYVADSYFNIANDSRSCRITDSSTTFYMYRQGHNLIVGSDDPNGCRWNFVDYNYKLMESDKNVNVFMDNKETGKSVKVNINIRNSTYSTPRYRSYKQISFFVCGNRVASDKLTCSPDGIVWMKNKDTLYRGKLEIAPVECKDNQEYAVVGIMEEMNFEYLFDDFAVSPDGMSVIVWNRGQTDRSLKSFWDKPIFDNLRFGANSIPATTGQYTELVQKFKETIGDGLAEQLFETSGLLSRNGEKIYPFITFLEEFVNPDDDGVPKLLKEVHRRFALNEGSTEEVSMKILGGLMTRAPWVMPIIVEAGWSEEQRDIRKSQITQIVGGRFSNLLQNVETYNSGEFQFQEEVLSKYKDIVGRLMRKITRLWVENKAHPGRTDIKIIEPSMSRRRVEQILEERSRVDIDKNEERLKLIRIKAIGSPRWIPYRDSEQGPPVHWCYVTHTTLTHIKAIDRTLVESIENGILNLNKFCLKKCENLDKKACDKMFDKFVDIFFEQTDTIVPAVNFMDNILDFFSADECYTVECEDGEILIPKGLMELYSNGYNAMRLRSAENDKRDPNYIRLLNINEHDAEYVKITKDIVKRAMHALIDPRTLWNESIYDNLDTLALCGLWILTDVQEFIIKDIVEKAEENDFEIIHSLLNTYPQATIDAVAKVHPSMMIHWQDFRIKLKVMAEIHAKAERGNTIVSLTSTEEKRRSSTKISQKWLLEKFLDKEKDGDLLEDFKQTVRKRQGTWTEPPRKRIHLED